jgi:hypothetical protein
MRNCGTRSKMGLEGEREGIHPPLFFELSVSDWKEKSNGLNSPGRLCWESVIDSFHCFYSLNVFRGA